MLLCFHYGGIICRRGKKPTKGSSSHLQSCLEPATRTVLWKRLNMVKGRAQVHIKRKQQSSTHGACKYSFLAAKWFHAMGLAPVPMPRNDQILDILAHLRWQLQPRNSVRLMDSYAEGWWHLAFRQVSHHQFSQDQSVTTLTSWSKIWCAHQTSGKTLQMPTTSFIQFPRPRSTSCATR